jgi:c-di-GMP-binding flagellar brake protein YcgR
LKVPKQERRTFSRKKVSLPAFVYNDDRKTKELGTGIITDISLGGLLISIPKGAKLQLSEDSSNNEIRMVFTLPEFQRSISVTCQPQRVEESEEAVQIGAAFVDSDFQSCQILQKYLM